MIWSWVSSSAYVIGDIFSILIPLLGSILAIFYAIYLLVMAIKKGLDEVLQDLQKRWHQLRNTLSRFISWVAGWRIWNIFTTGRHNLIFWISIFVIGSILLSISAGTSRIVKVDRIPEWMIWVDLQKSNIIQPGYHIYSPLISTYFLSPTNTFDFEIAEATANA